MVIWRMSSNSVTPKASRRPRLTRTALALRASMDGCWTPGFVPPNSSMYQVIARKYRPQAFAELIGQEHVRTTLENAIAQRRIAHGYILSGQRGTGKTTVARILARCLNCINGPTATPCGVCASCLEIAAGNSPDVIEIDAASNRGINEMRELRENVRYRPARDRYKVFIVDEAHQITSEAFNALLKTLEEPPEWAVFILCTTEVHKIPTTIASRCQQFSFRSVDFGEVVKRMEEICVKEGIETNPEVLSVLAQAGEGSVRDSLSALDQAIACCGAKLDAARSSRDARVVFARFVGRSDPGSDGRRFPAHAGSGDGAGAQRAQPAAFLPRTGALLPESAGGEGGGRQYQIDCGVGARAGATGRSGRRIFRGRSDALSAAHARSVQGPAVFAATAAASRDWFAAIDPGRQSWCRSKKRWPIWEAVVQQPTPKRQPPATSPPPPAASHQPPVTSHQPPATSQQPTGPWQDRLHAVAIELGMQTTADAIGHSEVAESNGKLTFLTPDDYRLFMNEKDILKIVQKVAGRADALRDSVWNAAGQRGAARKTEGRCVRTRAGSSGGEAIPGAVPGRAGPHGA